MCNVYELRDCGFVARKLFMTRKPGKESFASLTELVHNFSTKRSIPTIT